MQHLDNDLPSGGTFSGLGVYGVWNHHLVTLLRDFRRA